MFGFIQYKCLFPSSLTTLPIKTIMDFSYSGRMPYNFGSVIQNSNSAITPYLDVWSINMKIIPVCWLLILKLNFYFVSVKI